MTIEAATPAVQYEVRRQAVIAASLTQKFAHRADPITAAQAVAIDAALINLQAALAAAGYVPQGGGNKALVTDFDVLKLFSGPTSGNAFDATVRVQDGAVAFASLAADSVAIKTGATFPVQNSVGGAAVTGTAVVAGNAITGVAIPASARIIAQGSKHGVGTVTGTGTFGTFTVAGGVITGIVLSAS